MNTFKLLIYGTSLFIFISCGSENDPVPVVPDPDPIVPVFTIDASEYAILNGQGEETWFSLVDKTGSIVETKELVKPEKLIFTKPTQSDSLTLVRFSHYTGQINVTIYSGIKTKSTIKLAYIDGNIPPMPSFSGNANVKVINCPLSVNNPIVMSSPDVSFMEFPVDGQSLYSFPIYGDSTQLLLSARTTEGVPVYKLTSYVRSGNSLEEDFSEFIPYPNTVALSTDFDNLTYVIAGYNADWEYYGTNFTFGQWYNWDERGLPIIGYLPNYKGYYIEVSSLLAEDSFIRISYRKRGTLPQSSNLKLPTFSYTLKNALIKSPDVSIDHNFTYMHAFATYNPEGVDPVQFNLYAPKNCYPKINNLPAELLKKYPQADLSNINLGGFEFWESLDGYTYEQTLNDFFSHHYHVSTLEYRIYEFVL